MNGGSRLPAGRASLARPRRRPADRRREDDRSFEVPTQVFHEQRVVERDKHGNGPAERVELSDDLYRRMVGCEVDHCAIATRRLPGLSHRVPLPLGWAWVTPGTSVLSAEHKRPPSGGF